MQQELPATHRVVAIRGLVVVGDRRCRRPRLAARRHAAARKLAVGRREHGRADGASAAGEQCRQRYYCHR